MSLFVKAYQTTKHQMWASVKVLVLITFVFAILLYIAEHSVNNEFSFIDALVWTFVKYVEDPADVTTSPSTILGQIVGTLVGVLGIAIFAVPAGLIGSGLMDAMEDERHERDIADYRKRLRKTFRREMNKSLRGYLNTRPAKGGESLAKLNFVPQFVPVSRLQIRQGLDIKDIFEVCNKYPEFRLKNLAEAISDEERPEDRFVVNTFPANTSYGCCIDRGSKVTILCPTGFSEVGTGWFCYYLAKLGGFNYVCKEMEVDVDELDSFYNMSDAPLYDKKLTPASPATAFANKVLPTPGGPSNKIPLTGFTPFSTYSSLFFKLLIANNNSSFSSDIPATSLNFVVDFTAVVFFF